MYTQYNHIYTYMYICDCLYLYTSISISVSIYIYIYTCICISLSISTSISLSCTFYLVTLYHISTYLHLFLGISIYRPLAFSAWDLSKKQKCDVQGVIFETWLTRTPWPGSSSSWPRSGRGVKPSPRCLRRRGSGTASITRLGF